MPEHIFGAAAEFIKKKYGGLFSDTTAVESIGTIQQRVLTNDPERVFVLLVNLSTFAVHVGFDQLVTSTRGIFIPPNGGSYQADVEEDFTIPTRAMFAISATSFANLYVFTVQRESKIEVEVA